MSDTPPSAVLFCPDHLGPQCDADPLIAEAVQAARAAGTAVVVVANTRRVGMRRPQGPEPPGRQDDLVRAVAAANPETTSRRSASQPCPR
ncbi:hypothetical protein [Streptomyces sp. NBC_01794]|uniref:hypothetical protein n=1 Tax=Streptomyces sp. NBC_01794 TaxID=2975942 RepID=UPI0030889FE1|nr:hypothetical protein OIE54_29190 [Streptomyces sp. NBC_01794]